MNRLRGDGGGIRNHLPIAGLTATRDAAFSGVSGLESIIHRR